MSPRFTALLAAILLTGGCSGERDPLHGSWECSTSHPGNFVSSDTFDFDDEGAVTLTSDGVHMQGEFVKNGNTVTMNLTYVVGPDPLGRMVTKKQVFTSDIKKLTDDELEMDAASGNDHHLSRCRRS